MTAEECQHHFRIGKGTGMNMQTEKRLTPNISGTGAWAFSLGTSIGWGSLVVTGKTYLAQAGPLGFPC